MCASEHVCFYVVALSHVALRQRSMRSCALMQLGLAFRRAGSVLMCALLCRFVVLRDVVCSFVHVSTLRALREIE